MVESNVILFRKELGTEEEFNIAKKYFYTVEYRSQVPHDSTVIPRYSSLPFFKELENELAQSYSVLINPSVEYEFISDVFAWAGPGAILEGRTPKTWDNWSNLPSDKSFIVKGAVNSRKTLWSSHCFCKTKDDVPRVASLLLDDMLISQQRLVVREYVPLKKLGEGINGLPISNEHRTFWIVKDFQAHLLAKGFYWGTHPEEAERATLSDSGLIFAQETANIIAKQNLATFFVLDVAETESGEWILIEINDGGMSGLAMVDPEELYSNMAKIISN